MILLDAEVEIKIIFGGTSRLTDETDENTTQRTDKKAPLLPLLLISFSIFNSFLFALYMLIKIIKKRANKKTLDSHLNVPLTVAHT